MSQSTLSKIWFLLTPQQRKSAIGLLGLMIIGMVLETLGVGLVIPVIALITDENLAKNYPRLQPALDFIGNPDQKTLIFGAMLSLVGIYLLKAVFLGFLFLRQSRFAFGLQVSISQRLFTTYLRQPYLFHLQRNSATLINNATQEINQFTFGAILPGMGLITESLVVLGLGFLLLIAEPIGALMVVITLGGAALAFHKFTHNKVAAWGIARQQHEALRLQHLQQGLGGAKDVKLLGREDEFLTQYKNHSEQSAHSGQRITALAQLPRLWIELLAMIGLASIVLIMLAQGRSIGAIAPTLGLFTAAAFRLMPSVNRILNYTQSIRYGLATTNTLCTELKLNSQVPHTAPAITAPWQEITLREVCFTYPNAPVPALNHLSLAIQRGETIGFVGPSGSGKSTLVDVVLGLLTPSAGTILVGDSDIQKNLRGWQNQIGYVPQSIYLTDDSLRRNVAFGLADDKIDNAAVARAIRSAQLEEFVGTLPAGLETVVGERGIRLSGGQRQRIGIARALYHDPSVLVLDEATSALDTATEQGVMEAITALHGTKTILIVAHRLSTLENCDRLYRLEAGTLLSDNAGFNELISPAVLNDTAQCIQTTTEENKTRGTIFIHIGPHKTGTTSIQNFLENNAELLAKHNLCYISSEQLKWDRFDWDSEIDSVPLIDAKNSAEIKDLLSRGISVIISSEDLVGNPWINFYNQKQIVTQIKSQLGDKDCKIIIVIRNTPDWVESLYKQYLHEGGTLTVDQFIQVLDLTKTNYLKCFIDTWGDEFGHENLIPLKYEDGNNILSKFLSAINNHLLIKSDLTAQEIYLNQSIPIVIMPTIRILNKLNFNIRSFAQSSSLRKLLVWIRIEPSLHRILTDDFFKVLNTQDLNLHSALKFNFNKPSNTRSLDKMSISWSFFITIFSATILVVLHPLIVTTFVRNLKLDNFLEKIYLRIKRKSHFGTAGYLDQNLYIKIRNANLKQE